MLNLVLTVSKLLQVVRQVLLCLQKFPLSDSKLSPQVCKLVCMQHLELRQLLNLKPIFC